MTPPLVSAMMLTGTPGRDPAFAYAAIRCFTDQAWPEKELWILNCGKETLLDEVPAERLHEVMVPRSSMGHMRQQLLDQCRGEFVIQWDDDDLSMPNRMTAQVTPLIEDPTAEAVYLYDQYRYSFKTNCALIANNSYGYGIDGTVCFRNKSATYRANLDMREDTVLHEVFTERGTARVIRDPSLYIRTHTGKNIMAEKFVMRYLAGKRHLWALNARECEFLTEALSQRYPVLYRREPIQLHVKIPLGGPGYGGEPDITPQC